MGGKNPAVIFDDANLDEAVPAVVASMQFNSGQNMHVQLADLRPEEHLPALYNGV